MLTRISMNLGKGKVNHTPQESIGGCSSPSSRPWARRWRTTNVCDAWPVQRQTYGYLPSRKASLPIGWYQIILLGDRGICVLTTCSGLHSTAGRLGFEPTTYWSHSGTLPLCHRHFWQGHSNPNHADPDQSKSRTQIIIQSASWTWLPLMPQTINP